MCSEMLSPYPFSKFAVVENFFPTGYGMPSYTVLGRSIIHLPFIVYTSLGHEVLHNWWGNSVYTDDDGNWCEGLTSYQADYFYKLQKSEAEATQYRKDLLKDYTVYASDKKDFSPAKFSNRTDMATRAIGYGKVAMIFHMIEEHLGHATFANALKLIIARHQWTKTSYDDIFTVFEEVSGENLSEFKQKWINEGGNPKLELIEKDAYLFIKQTDAIKPMWIDVEVQMGETIRQDKIFSNAETVIIPNIEKNVTQVIVDPDYHQMRLLDASEMDMTLRHLLNENKFSFVIPNFSDPWQNLAITFASSINSEAEFETIVNENSAKYPTKIYLGVLPKNQKIDACETITENSALVWAFRQNIDKPGLIIYSENIEQLSPLVRKLPHYGKYGYLIFENGQNIAKGNHETIKSPLIWQK